MSIIQTYIIKQKIKTKNAFEKVYIASRVGDTTPFILKSFNIKNRSSEYNFFREKAVNFEHKNICKLIDFFQTDTHYIIIREFLNGFDLKFLFENKKIRSDFETNTIIKIIIEALEGLKILHQNNIIHRDIRPANIFLCNEQGIISKKSEFNVKLVDFGMAKVPELEKIDKFKPFALIYSSPEQVLKFTELTNQTSDLYSTGLTLWILLNNKLPFNHKIPEIIANLQLSYELPKTNKTPANLYKIIQKATTKHIFKKPFNYYSKQDLKKFMQDAQQNRYQQADDMIKDLQNCL